MTITINLTSSTGVNFNADFDSYFADFTSTGWPYILGGANLFQGNQIVLLGQNDSGDGTQTKAVILDGSNFSYYFSNHTLSGTLTTVRLSTLGGSYNSDGSFDQDSSGHITGVDTTIEITGLNISNAYGSTGPLHNTIFGLMGGSTSGTNGSDPSLLESYIWGEAHLVNGSAGGDTYYGTQYGDTVYGNGGNDTLSGRGGNDVIDGGEGSDTAVYAGARADYTWVQNPDGSWTVTDTRAGDVNEGVDTLTSIEFLKFSDQTVALAAPEVNTAPVITSNGGGAAAAVSVLENGTAVTTVAATDANAGAVVVFSIVGGADAALFQIDPATGVLTFKSAPDFESPADAGANNVYDVVVRATDNGGLFDEQAIAVMVTNVGEAVNTPPVITSNGGGASAAISIAENGTAVTTVAATDADAGAVLTYSISGGADAALFQIDAATGALVFKSAPDFEAPADAGANNVYDVVVRATDNTGLFDEQALAISVSDVADTVILGTSGKDKLVGTSGNDTLNGLAGADTLTGGKGDDTYIVDDAKDKVVESAGEGTDLVLSSVTYKLANNVENLTLTGASAINGTGNNANNVIIGNSAANKLSGSGGNDTLEGGAGNDTLAGGSGNDILYGGLGADALNGNSGADTFVYKAVEESTLASFDTISGFSAKTGDMIDLSAIDANSIGGTDNDAFVYIGAQEFSGTAGELRFANGFLQGDTNGDGTADLSIKLSGVKSLSEGNIIL